MNCVSDQALVHTDLPVTPHCHVGGWIDTAVTARDTTVHPCTSSCHPVPVVSWKSCWFEARDTPPPCWLSMPSQPQVASPHHWAACCHQAVAQHSHSHAVHIRHIHHHSQQSLRALNPGDPPAHLSSSGARPMACSRSNKLMARPSCSAAWHFTVGGSWRGSPTITSAWAWEDEQTNQGLEAGWCLGAGLIGGSVQFLWRPSSKTHLLLQGTDCCRHCR